MTAQKPNQTASAVHPCASDSRSAHPRTSGRPFESRATMSRMAPSSRFLLIRQFSASPSPQSPQRVRGRMLLATAFVAPVAVSSFISAPRLTTAQAERGVRSHESDTMTETPNLRWKPEQQKGCSLRESANPAIPSRFAIVASRGPGR